MKKAKYIYAVEKGELIKRENVNVPDNQSLINEILKTIVELNSNNDDESFNISLEEVIVEGKVIKTPYFFVHIKNFSRSHMSGPFAHPDFNPGEIMRSRVTEGDISKWKDMQMKFGVPQIILSVYDCLDKFVYVVLNATEITSSSKSDIKYDTRINEVTAYQIKDAYHDQKIKTIHNPERIITSTYIGNSDNLLDLINHALTREENSTFAPSKSQLVSDFFAKLLKLKELNQRDVNVYNRIIGLIGEFVQYVDFSIKYKTEEINWISFYYPKTNHDFEINNGKTIYYEVKSTASENRSFIISNNEMQFAKKNRNSWYLSRIFLENIMSKFELNNIESGSELFELIRKHIDDIKIDMITWDFIEDNATNTGARVNY